jgi:long-chain acyl-CoA synthetase
VSFRIYSDGLWYQLSGNDFLSHLAHMQNYWQQEELNPLPEKTIILVGLSSYTQFVISLSALLQGFHVICYPPQFPLSLFEEQIKSLNIVAVATELPELGHLFKFLNVPIFNLSHLVWRPLEEHKEPAILNECRNIDFHSRTKKGLFEKLPPFGQLYFLSVGHTNLYALKKVNINALLVASQMFVDTASVPSQIFWKSVEFLVPCTAFSYISKFSILLKEGIVGFPNTAWDFETNLKILRPTCLFFTKTEMDELMAYIQRSLSKIDSSQKARVDMKIPVKVFERSTSFLRKASRLVLGRSFVEECVGELEFIVYGLSSLYEGAYQTLEKLGLPVLETYGTTHAAGLLSANIYSSPYYNHVGNLFPYVECRLVHDSKLEYRLLHPVFKDTESWHKTDDYVVMTPFGLSVQGRRSQMLLTVGGTVLSPFNIEGAFKQYSLIKDICVLGDKKPYLVALIFPNLQCSSHKTKEQVQEEVLTIVTLVNKTLPRNQTIKKIALIEKPFTLEKNEIFLTGEVNRTRIYENYKDVVEGLYS